MGGWKGMERWVDGWRDAWKSKCSALFIVEHRRGVCEVSLYKSFNCAVCLKIQYNVGEMFVDKPCNTDVHTLLKTHGLGLPWWSRG